MDRFELAFSGSGGSVAEIRKLSDPFVEVDVTDVRGIDFGMGFVQRQSDIVRVIPGKTRHAVYGSESGFRVVGGSAPQLLDVGALQRGLYGRIHDRFSQRTGSPVEGLDLGSDQPVIVRAGALD